MKELFHLIQPFCFLDYSLLETAITFLIDPAHKVVGDLSEYVEQLTKFKKSTTIKYFMQSIENAQKFASWMLVHQLFRKTSFRKLFKHAQQISPTR